MTKAEVENIVYQLLGEELKEIKDMLADRRVNNGKQDQQLAYHEAMLNKIYEKVEYLSQDVMDLRTDIERRDKHLSRWITGTILTVIATLIGVLSVAL